MPPKEQLAATANPLDCTNGSTQAAPLAYMDTRINEKLTYFLYARKSSESEDRQVQSIEDQINHFKKVAGIAGLEIVEVFTESQSAKMPNNRPVFSEMLKRIERGEANGIVCWKLDRLARNPVDAGTITWLLQTGIIKHIRTFDGGYFPTDNVLLMGVEFGIANQYIIDLRKNCRRGMEGKANRGWMPSCACLGYLNDKAENIIIPDKERFTLVRQMWDMMLSGNYTPPQIRKIANKEWGFKTPKHKRLGGKELSNTTMYKMFGNIFYTGMFRWGGVLYQGNHMPMITVEEYERVQVLLGRKSSPRSQRHEFAYTGMLECGMCRSMFTATEKLKFVKSKKIWKAYKYYHCTHKKARQTKCTNMPINEDELERQIEAELERYTIAPEFLTWISDILNAETLTLSRETNAINSTREKTILETQREIDTLTRMRYRELIGDAEYINEKTLLSDKIITLKVQLNEGTDYDKKSIKLTENAFRFSVYALRNFKNGSKETKREIVATLGSNYRLIDRLFLFQASVWLITIKDAYPALYAESRRLELKNIVDIERRNAVWAHFIQRLSSLVYDVRTRIQENIADVQIPIQENGSGHL